MYGILIGPDNDHAPLAYLMTFLTDSLNKWSCLSGWISFSYSFKSSSLLGSLCIFIFKYCSTFSQLWKSLTLSCHAIPFKLLFPFVKRIKVPPLILEVYMFTFNIFNVNYEIIYDSFYFDSISEGDLNRKIKQTILLYTRYLPLEEIVTQTSSKYFLWL